MLELELPLVIVNPPRLAMVEEPEIVITRDCWLASSVNLSSPQPMIVTEPYCEALMEIEISSALLVYEMVLAVADVWTRIRSGFSVVPAVAIAFFKSTKSSPAVKLTKIIFISLSDSGRLNSEYVSRTVA